ncbi:pyridoxamine 5'-phosphate oxidase family protein [Mycobacterium sp. 4D054]|uniref:pyridoxamine 5'-phosphate oxidase family protein n=1 Tax=unclassified Mycobacterium TaxID=2642494 RepID=UPI0021B47AA5|nr:pyridoxamine 5'-phosphate oxidase family protein [Mycobacterium sp. SMC-8]UXA14129.1 pyridoxamine 5'-phosphate oxidase family protein [Mycobacterium sp. SMC-8]
MSHEGQPVSILSVSECWDLLAGAPLGRLVTCVDGEPYIFPINFAVQNRTVLFSTAEGTKLIAAAISKEVLFEADGYNSAEGWSVIVKGPSRSLRTDEEIAEAECAGLMPWTATVKTHFVRIRPFIVSGRRFVFGAAPDGN